MIERFEQFTGAISAIYRYIQKLEREEMSKYRLKGAFAQYLLAMDAREVTAAELCELCEKDKAAVSRVVTEMEEKGLVVRRGSSYRAVLQLTEAGQQAAAFVRRRAVAAVELAGGGLEEGQRKALYEALEHVAGRLQEICRSGLPEEP